MKMLAIDNGFWLISRSSAQTLCGDNPLPKAGRERNVEHGGQWYWLKRTMHGGKMRWSLRLTEWQHGALKSTQATL